MATAFGAALLRLGPLRPRFRRIRSGRVAVDTGSPFHASPTIDSDFGDWTIAPKPYLLDRCIRHKTFQGEFGCRLCEIAIQPADAPLVWEVTSTYTTDGTINGETVDREIWQIPDELVPRVLAVAGDPEPPAVGVRIKPSDLEPVSVIIGRRLDPHARHRLSKAVA
ncbi:hypothetical protein [Nocardia brasiliensis]|uniref:hypothetical protein n=1 Tax=Nocardia brasiliensis TaxID=37326 RepID=UPI0011B225B9|nr:hypothetical protein [Nocardia brasiliensis]